MLPSYRHATIHGVALLVKDPSTGKLRFGRRGVDHPDRCISSAADLPDCEMTLHAFESEAAMKAWEKGLPPDDNRELLSHGGRHGPTVVLELRLDRPRRPGDGLSEVVALGTALPERRGPESLAEETVDTAPDRAAVARSARDPKAEWRALRAGDIAAFAAAGYEVSPEPVPDTWGNSDRWGVKAGKILAGGLGLWVVAREGASLARTGHELTVTLADGRSPDPPLSAEGLETVYAVLFRTAAAKIGFEIRSKSGHLQAPVYVMAKDTPLDAKALATFEAAVVELGRLKESLMLRQAGASGVDKVLLDRPVVNLVAKAYAGCPPVLFSTASRVESQVTPRSGNTMPVTHVVGRAERLGLVERCWEGRYFADDGRDPPVLSPESYYLSARGTVWGLTELGRALAEEDMEYLHEHFPAEVPLRAPVLAAAEMRCPTRDQLTDVNRYASASLMRQTRRALEVKFAALEGARTDEHPFEGHLIVTGLALGVLRVDIANRRIEPRDPAIEPEDIVQPGPGRTPLAGR